MVKANDAVQREQSSIGKPRLEVTRRPWGLTADDSRVIARYFQSGDEDRSHNVVQRVMKLPEEEVCCLLKKVEKEYSHRHHDFEKTLERHFKQGAARFIPGGKTLSSQRRLLLGAYFTMEYSVESAALFNPSIVPHPIQENVTEGSLRFIMSLRATGEGHISSVVFRSGIINAAGVISLDAVSRYIETPNVVEGAEYDKHLFELKLNEMNACNPVTTDILNRLPDHFTFQQLLQERQNLEREGQFPEDLRNETFWTMEWLARSNYVLQFHSDRRISERVIFPVSDNERGGIEDARFVLFTEEDGSSTYYATYTAYNGSHILPQLIQTQDFLQFKIITLNGKAVQNKGMALFPRRIDGKYVMISRQDGVNMHIMYSDHLHFWQKATIIQRPQNPWEFTQMGNCGSPVETKAGWLLLTHGVGPMREYCIGVELLDLHDPSKIIARLDQPILSPNKYEREGYVPNVVYTCGYMIHQDQLIIPYAMSDQNCAVASVSVSELLERLLQ
jgi:predicted GH43/DUF377 family glycosyl hydrolase